MKNSNSFERKRKRRHKQSIQQFIMASLLFLLASFSIFYINNDAVSSEDKSIPSHKELASKDSDHFFELNGKEPFSYLSDINPLQKTSVKSILQIKSDLSIRHTNRQIEVDTSTDVKGNGSKSSDQLDTGKTVYLTFDDGPSIVTDQLLAVLETYNAKATFFMIDGNIRRFPDSVKKMVEQGHSIGSHSVSHQIDTFYQSSNSVINEMNQVRNTILEITGVETALIRTPYGSNPHMTDEYKQAVHENGFIMWDWNVDSKDWYYGDYRYVETVLAQVENRLHKTDPIVILLHDREETLLHLPALLENLKNQNISFQPLNRSISPVAFR